AEDPLMHCVGTRIYILYWAAAAAEVTPVSDPVCARHQVAPHHRPPCTTTANGNCPGQSPPALLYLPIAGRCPVPSSQPSIPTRPILTHPIAPLPFPPRPPSSTPTRPFFSFHRLIIPSLTP